MTNPPEKPDKCNCGSTEFWLTKWNVWECCKCHQNPVVLYEQWQKSKLAEK